LRHLALEPSRASEAQSRGEIRLEHRQALPTWLFGRDRDAAREVGDKAAFVEIAQRPGNGGIPVMLPLK